MAARAAVLAAAPVEAEAVDAAGSVRILFAKKKRQTHRTHDVYGLKEDS